MNRWPATVGLPVQRGDMHSFGHVNNVVYLRWFESARIAYFERASVLSQMPDLGPILARQEIDYRAPLAYPDQVLVSCTATRLGNTSFTLGLRLRSEKRQGALAAEGISVMMDYRNGRKAPLGDELRKRIAELEASGAADAP